MSSSLDFYDPIAKDKKKKHNLRENGYDHKRSEEIADQMEDFLNDVSMLVIIVGKKYDKIKKAKKVIKQMIKDLRNGREEKVFNESEYEEYLDKYGY